MSAEKSSRQGITRTINVIKALAGHEFEGLRLKQVALSCELDMATCSRILEGLAAEGVTMRDSHHSELWRLGPALVQIAIAFQSSLAAKQQQLVDLAHTYTRQPN